MRPLLLAALALLLTPAADATPVMGPTPSSPNVQCTILSCGPCLPLPDAAPVARATEAAAWSVLAAAALPEAPPGPGGAESWPPGLQAWVAAWFATAAAWLERAAAALATGALGIQDGIDESLSVVCPA